MAIAIGSAALAGSIVLVGSPAPELVKAPKLDASDLMNHLRAQWYLRNLTGANTRPLDMTVGQAVTVTYAADVVLEDRHWHVQEQIQVPPDAASRIEDIARARESTASGESAKNASDAISIMATALPDWTAQDVDGIRTFHRSRTVPFGASDPFPLTSIDTIALPVFELEQGRVTVWPRAGSTVVLRAPQHVIRHVDPPADRTPVGGQSEAATIQLGPTDAAVVIIEALSPVGRTEIGRGLLDFSLSGLAITLAGGAGTVGMALFIFVLQERIRRPPPGKKMTSAPPLPDLSTRQVDKQETRTRDRAEKGSSRENSRRRAKAR